MNGGKKWQKGQSGNPSGRPKSVFSFKKELEIKLSEVNEKDYLKRTYGRMLIDKAVNLALRGQGNIRAISEVLDRYVGKPAQAVSLDANLNVTREQRIAHIEELLTSLPLPKDPDDGPSDPRVN